jgi:diguanylate cyclase (GGDEF)-like protein
MFLLNGLLLIRRAYEEKIKEFNNLYLRTGQDFAIVFFDIDHFKRVNDTYGHEGGDVVLKIFATLLLKLTRETDIIGRYGGEEFVAAVYYKNLKELSVYITRIKSVIKKYKFIFKEHKIEITFSAGIELRSRNKSVDETIANADKLLYKAKNTGRDKVVFWNGEKL